MPTQDDIWTGKVPENLPANTFMTIQFVRTGRGACINLEDCGQFIQNESPEFITYDNKSVITRLPNGGIRTTVPTPTSSKSASSSASSARSTSSHTIMTTVTRLSVPRTSLIDLETVSPSPDPPSHTPTIIAGVAGGVGGLLVGSVIGALALVCLGRQRDKKRPKSFLGPTDIAARGGYNDIGAQRDEIVDGNLLSPVQPGDRTGPSPEMRGRWAGGTRYEPLNPDDANVGDGRRVATLEFQPRTGLGIST